MGRLQARRKKRPEVDMSAGFPYHRRNGRETSPPIGRSELSYLIYSALPSFLLDYGGHEAPIEIETG